MNDVVEGPTIYTIHLKVMGKLPERIRPNGWNGYGGGEAIFMGSEVRRIEKRIFTEDEMTSK